MYWEIISVHCVLDLNKYRQTQSVDNLVSKHLHIFSHCGRKPLKNTETILTLLSGTYSNQHAH